MSVQWERFEDFLFLVNRVRRFGQICIVISSALGHHALGLTAGSKCCKSDHTISVRAKEAITTPRLFGGACALSFAHATMGIVIGVSNAKRKVEAIKLLAVHKNRPGNAGSHMGED